MAMATKARELRQLSSCENIYKIKDSDLSVQVQCKKEIAYVCNPY